MTNTDGTMTITARALNLTKRFVGTKLPNPATHGINLNDGYVVACDGFRMMTVRGGVDAAANCVLPVPVKSKVKTDGEMTIDGTIAQITWRDSKTGASTSNEYRIIDGEPLNWRKILNADVASITTLDAAMLKDLAQSALDAGEQYITLGLQDSPLKSVYAAIGDDALALIMPVKKDAMSVQSFNDSITAFTADAKL